jgi:hypothetical protein
MPTANRRLWMRDYMKEYRQGRLRGGRVEGHPQAGISTKLEELRKTQRLQSFKWRIAALLSSQYEILLCLQYGPRFGNFRWDDGSITVYSQDFCNDKKETLQYFPILRDFKDTFEVGGDEIFKALVLRKYNRKFNQYTSCVVGVLDKASLLDQLYQMPNQGGKKWENVFSKAKKRSQKGRLA